MFKMYILNFAKVKLLPDQVVSLATRIGAVLTERGVLRNGGPLLHWRRGPRQNDREGGAFSGLALNGNLAVQRGGEVLDD